LISSPTSAPKNAPNNIPTAGIKNIPTNKPIVDPIAPYLLPQTFWFPKLVHSNQK
jgi:hypothetical protein